ncbi:MAG: Gfo/Idh/MocA family protein [Aristaeellaceae bacterium]
MTRFALVGGGWRAAFFARIAQSLPEQFQLTGTYLRNPEKRGAWQERFGGHMAASMEELLLDKPDFLILSVSKGVSTDILIQLMDFHIPILCETPPANTLEDMHRLWAAAQEKHAVVQVAEQYLDWPMYQAWQTVVREGMLGQVSNFSLSAVHTYHAVSMIRGFLGAGWQNVALTGCRHSFPVRQTDSRQGIITDGAVRPEIRDRLTFQFEDGKVAFFDFSGVQYHSFIRTRQFNLQGDQGEIDDLILRRIGPDGLPLCQTLTRHDMGLNNNNHLCCLGLELGGRWLWRNPYLYARLNDDELAIAQLMERMGRLSRGESDTPAYSLADGLQDAYIGLMMEEALTHPWQTIHTQTQPWAK